MMIQMVSPRRFLILIYAALLTLLAACSSKSSSVTNSSPEIVALADAYRSKIALTHVGLARGENYLGGAIYYVQGKAKNVGDKPIQQLELMFEFRDYQNKVISRETRMALNYKGGGNLAAQATSDFQVGFENLPEKWNYALPDVSVIKVVFR